MSSSRWRDLMGILRLCSNMILCLWCDKRFVGDGGSKAACLFKMYLFGVSFRVLAVHRLIHQSQQYEEEATQARKSENIYSDCKDA
ncbi:glycosyltransferase family 49 protein [Neolentinus lepideus HHB14362 ss-1]|uniref:Glycosyltransferase family 49 protein n=1 Tax=Neolentinus lepideus HHB14362 ss-1 TaxID=1314782 RepID=A0A165PV87_9AGAM|nr:glycosyltransferase family 49 protein [Neolentinus lepideus HHB14362 ss-1]